MTRRSPGCLVPMRAGARRRRRLVSPGTGAKELCVGRRARGEARARAGRWRGAQRRPRATSRRGGASHDVWIERPGWDGWENHSCGPHKTRSTAQRIWRLVESRHCDVDLSAFFVPRSGTRSRFKK